MKCPDCGYDIEKPNQKTCPCCGASLKIIIAQPAEEVEQPESSEQEPAQPEPPLQEVPPSVEPQQVCPRCKKAVPDGFNFCPHCGYDMREPAESAPVEEVPLATLSASQAVSQEAQRYEPEPLVKETEPEIKPGPHRYEPQYTPYQPEPEHYEPEPEHYQPENNDYKEVEEENPEMGGYYPYPGEEPTADTGVDVPESPATGSSSSWLVIAIASIVSLLLGALLYLVFN